MHAHLVPYLVLLVLMFLGAVLMLTSSFLKSAPYADWVRIDLRIAGVAMLFVVVAKLALLFLADSMSPFARQALDYIRTVSLGMSAGLILLLFLSGAVRSIFLAGKK